MTPVSLSFHIYKNGDGNYTGLTGFNEISDVKTREIFITHLGGIFISWENGVKLVALCPDSSERGTWQRVCWEVRVAIS